MELLRLQLSDLHPVLRTWCLKSPQICCWESNQIKSENTYQLSNSNSNNQSLITASQSQISSNLRNEPKLTKNKAKIINFLLWEKIKIKSKVEFSFWLLLCWEAPPELRYNLISVLENEKCIIWFSNGYYFLNKMGKEWGPFPKNSKWSALIYFPFCTFTDRSTW